MKDDGNFYHSRIREIEKGDVMNNDLDYLSFDVGAELSGNDLYANLIVDKNLVYKDYTYLFYLIKDGQVIDYGSWSESPKYKWRLNEDGIYCVQGYIRNGEKRLFKRSYPISFFSADFKKQYHDFLSDCSEIGKDCYKENINGDYLDTKLHYIASENPYADFCLLTSKKWGGSKLLETEGKIGEFITKYPMFNLMHLSWNNEVYCCFTGGSIEASDGLALFSGISRSNRKIVIGAEDIQSIEELKDLNEGYGCFTGLFIDDSKQTINLFRDGFGMGKIFYYEDDEMVCVGNNYHSFLLFLKSLDRKLSFDEVKAAVILSSFSVQLLNQNICRKMDISQITQISSDYILVYCDCMWKKTSTQYGSIIAGDITRCLYEDLLHRARQEMEDTIKLLYEDKRFNKVVVDLSGGIDSRLVYSLVTGLKQEQKSKTRILSYDVPNTEDLSIAIDINSVFGLQWDDLPREAIVMKIHDADQYMRNRELGIYYSYKPFIKKYCWNDACYIRLNGAFGETLYRPFATRHYLDMIDDNKKFDAKRLASFILQDISYKINAPVNEEFISILSNELEEIGCNNVYESLESMHRQYHHGSHHSYQMFFERDELRWPVLQSKTAALLHHYMINTFCNTKLQFDMIGQANPLLLGFRYDYKKNNDDYEKLICTLCVEDRFKGIKNMHGSSEGESQWIAADTTKNRLLKISNPTEYTDNYMQEYSKMIESRSRAIMKQLLNKKTKLNELVGMELYYYICGDKVNWQYLYNKLSSFWDQINLIEG